MQSERRARLQGLMLERDLSAVVLRDHASFAWYTGGADSRVERAIREGAADLVVTVAGEEYVVTSVIEGERMREEQTPALTVLGLPWTEDRDEALRTVVGNAPVGADLPIPGIAWNPSVTGAKAEETFVLTASGPEVVAGAAVPVAQT